MEVLSIISAYILDLAFGDPHWLPHPVRIIGKVITSLEKKLRNGRGKYALRLKGAGLTIVVVGGCVFITWVILNSLKKINPVLAIIVWIFLAYTSLAIKDLFIHAKRVLERIENKDIEGARYKLSFIVGRDTKDLREEKIITATIESIAENTNDGIIAPLLYLILGGPVLAITYKAINTLDSMIGYKNERYMYFGWFAARLDDVVNFIPARIAGWLIVVSSFISGGDFRGSFKIMLRDGRKHPSPNSGISEAAMAGALGIRLGGPSTYQGELEDKPYIGEDKRQINPLLIKEALLISFLTSLLMVLLGVLVKWAI